MAGETWKAHAAVVGLYALLTILLAYPVSLSPATRLLADDPDAHLYLWTMGWNAQALATAPARIFDANIYFPERLTLAYSENLIGTALFAAPVVWLTGNLVLALNVALLATPILCGWGAYVLARRVGASLAAAVLCGLVFAFSPARFFRLPQPHVTAVQWLPFMLAFLHAYLETGRARHLRAAAGFFTLQALATGHGAAFALVGGGLLAGWRILLGERLAPLRRARDLGLAGVLLLAPAAALYLPYRAVQDELGLRRSLVDWAPTWASFASSPSTMHTWLAGVLPGPHLHEAASAFLFPGFVPIALAVAALWWRGSASPRDSGVARDLRRWRRVAVAVELLAAASLALATYVWVMGPIRWRMDGALILTARDPLRPALIAAALVGVRAALARAAPVAPAIRLRWRVEQWRGWAQASRTRPGPFYALLTIVGLLLAMGPPLGIWPLVYWLPGLSFIRVPSRFMVLAVLGLAVLAAIGCDRLRTHLRPGRQWAIAASIGAVFLVESSGVPLPAVPFTVDPPVVDRWLADQPRPFAIAEVPVYPVARSQTVYMLHATAHWQRTVHGYSGAQPRLHDDLYDLLRGFPDAASLDRLAALGVDYLVVHPALYEPGEWARVGARLPAFADRLELVFEAAGDRVYRVRR